MSPSLLLAWALVTCLAIVLYSVAVGIAIVSIHAAMHLIKRWLNSQKENTTHGDD
ncbi:hypothetical protein [Rhodococcus sp. 11-3]|uniref:hypothetical protein n=1 Tax=Rhodococcus sp. 11-3 TaxID=2854796 RepID=UPI00203A95A6|nr:hypothetical protein [Rhodococcus sp. 11-3]USC16999.1 hypothetical protein KZJ41_09095 [Rhodococcus sp. 11-3]